jgi:hypothetical protein
MKWFTSWWGVEIEAETEEDEALLRCLAELLPDRPIQHYEDGSLTTSDKLKTKFIEHEGFTLTFHR